MEISEANTLLLGTNNPIVHMAYNICKEYHAGQEDKNGRVYHEHPVRIALNCDSDEEKIVALLHDIIEDTKLNAMDLENFGIPKECITAIILLTKSPQEHYGDYIKKIKESGNQLAIRVKILDLKDNSNLTRISVLIEKDLIRTEKYLRALKILLEFNE